MFRRPASKNLKQYSTRPAYNAIILREGMSKLRIGVLFVSIRWCSEGLGFVPNGSSLTLQMLGPKRGSIVRKHQLPKLVRAFEVRW
jgi:hypothetical protein